MGFEISGVPAKAFEETIFDALLRISEYTGERVTFDAVEDAAQLERVTEAKVGYSGRSATPVRLHGNVIGELVVVAFAPLDGTGSFEDFKPGEIKNPTLPDTARYFLRSKDAVHSEAHLTIASKSVDANTEPVLFAGHLGIIGVQKGTITKIGHVGQDREAFAAAMTKGEPATPATTLTVGYKGVLHDGSRQGERFGDPHAIVNLNLDNPSVQVAGFLAITREAGAGSIEALRRLNAREPFLRNF